MTYKPIRFIPDDTKIPFLLLSRFGFFFSGLVSLASVLLFIFVGLNVGVDFKGGTVLPCAPNRRPISTNCAPPSTAWDLGAYRASGIWHAQ